MTGMCPYNCPYRQINGYCQITVCINPKYHGLRYSTSTDWRVPKTYINYTIKEGERGEDG